MTLQHISICLATAALTLLCSCGGKQSGKASEQVETITVVEHDSLRDAVSRHDRKTVKSMADELALNADDLSPQQAVSVLMGFYDLHLQYSRERKMKSDMETMRKFVDVYDIVISNHGDDFRSALEATREIYPDADFITVYKDFTEKLSQYDGSWLSDTAPVADTTATDSASESEMLPPELRPAE